MKGDWQKTTFLIVMDGDIIQDAQTWLKMINMQPNMRSIRIRR